MPENERQLLDARGKLARVIQDGRPINDADWIDCRVLLSNKRLVLATGDDQVTVPLADVAELGGRHDVNQDIASVSNYVSFRYGDDVLLVTAGTDDGFEKKVFAALLNGEVVLVRHPAVEGGVVQDTDWEKARLKLDGAEVLLSTASGSMVTIPLADVGGVETGHRTVVEDTREVVEVEHSEDGASVQTHFAGSGRSVSVLESLFSKGESQNELDVDLSATDRQVLMALYSGVSPFEIPEFTGLDVEEVEETFEELVELEILREIRMRREVDLTTRGRNLASEAIDEE